MKSLVKTAQSFHYLATEEIIVSQLLKQGQSFVDDKLWDEAIGVFEEADKMQKWNEIYGP